MGTDLIIDYLDVLRAGVGSRRDAGDIVAEVEDHLRAHAEALEHDSCAPDEAARAALDAFGDPRLVARGFLTTPAGTLAVPTAQTRTAGTIAKVSAGLWLLALGLWVAQWVLERVVDPNGSFQPLFYLGILALASASALMCATAFGLRDRHGRELGALGAVGLGVLIVGTASTFVIGWAVPVWMTLLAIGTAGVAVAVLRRPYVPRLPAVLLVCGPAAGAAVFAVTRALELGHPDEFGDYPIATFSGLTVGCLLIAAAMFTTGRWLAGEEPFADDAVAV